MVGEQKTSFCPNDLINYRHIRFSTYWSTLVEHGSKLSYVTLREMVADTDWTDEDMRSKFQNTVNKVGGDMVVSCWYKDSVIYSTRTVLSITPNKCIS